jgi:gas vesicle protein
MSDRNKFSSGFWLGTIVGGVVGGIVGASIANKRANRLEDELDSSILSSNGSDEKRPLKSSRRMRKADRMEIARRSLDDKISDLNNAIDAVRSSVGQVPGSVVDLPLNSTEGESPIDAEG